MKPNTKPDMKAVMQAALQKAGVPFNKAMSVSARELARAELDPQWFNRLVRELTTPKRRVASQKAEAERRIHEAFRINCSGIQIPVMKLGDVFKAGHDAIAAGADDAELGRTLRTVASALSVA